MEKTWVSSFSSRNSCPLRSSVALLFWDALHQCTEIVTIFCTVRREVCSEVHWQRYANWPLMYPPRVRMSGSSSWLARLQMLGWVGEIKKKQAQTKTKDSTILLRIGLFLERRSNILLGIRVCPSMWLQMPLNEMATDNGKVTYLRLGRLINSTWTGFTLLVWERHLVEDFISSFRSWWRRW